MATVYRARHRNGHRVAIKVLRSDLVVHRTVVERFLVEGYVANRVDHPAIVRVLDDGIADDGCPFLVMELLEGTSLDLHVRRGKKERLPPLSEEEAGSVVETLAEVLVEAEASGVIHRDIKPSNVFRTRDGAIKLLDFGIAFVADEPIAHATATGMAMGTPAFMAPEQARGRKELMGAWSDQFSAAATVLTLLAGRPLRGGGTYAEDFAMAMVQPFPRAATLGVPIGPALGAVLDRAVSLDVGARFPSATSFLQAIRDARRTPALPLDELTLRVSKPEIGTGTVRMGADVARAVSAAVAAHGASKSPQPVPPAPGSRPSLPNAQPVPPVPRSWPSLPDDVPVPPAPRSRSALSEATPLVAAPFQPTPPDRRRYFALGGAAFVGVVVIGVALRSLQGSPTSAANASVTEAVAVAPKPEPLASAPVLPVPAPVTGPSAGTPERTSHSASASVTPAPTASVAATASARTVPKPAYEVLSEPGSERVSDANRARVFLNAGNYTAVRTLLDPKARAGRADAEEKAILRAACKGLKDFECLARVH